MNSENDSNSDELLKKASEENYALRLGTGMEFAEFEPLLWRLTIYHVLGVSRQVSLGYAETCLLAYFAKHAGEIISRQDLLDHAWDDRVVSSGSLNQAVSTLRGLLGDDQRREIIITVPRRGYQFNSDVLIDWPQWRVEKKALLNVDSHVHDPDRSQVEEDLIPKILSSSTRVWGNYHITSLIMIGLSLSLMTGLFLNYYYVVFPPYKSEHFESANTKLTMIGESSEELNVVRDITLQIFNRMGALGGGRVLVNRSHNYLEISCLRQDKTMHTLLVNIERALTIDEIHLRRCLK
jgi:cholera toxin transcriptional activator